MSDMVGNPEDWFSHVTAQIVYLVRYYTGNGFYLLIHHENMSMQKYRFSSTVKN